MPESPPLKSTASSTGLWLRLAGLLAVVTLSIAIYFLRHRIVELQQVGYASAFLVNAFASSSVLLPMPGLVYTYGLGALLNPALVGICAGCGATLGEVTGYIAGYSGAALIENRRLYERLLILMRRQQVIATLTVFLLALVPNPFFDIVGLAAGMAKLPLPRFVFATLAGNICKAMLTAYAGAWSIDWLQPLLN